MGMKIGGNNDNKMHMGSQRPFTRTDKQNLDENTSARHTHTNKDILDGITADKVAEWDAGGSGGDANVQPDWEQTDGAADDYIKNKPDLSKKEDTANKVTSLTSSSTNVQYPGAKAVYNFVRDRVSSIYRFLGSSTLSSLGISPIYGQGSAYNMIDSGTRTFENAIGCDVSLSVGDTHKIMTFPFALPEDTFVSVSFYNTSSADAEQYTIYNVKHIDYFEDGETFYHLYEDTDGVLDDVDVSDVLYVTNFVYTLSVSAGDNAVYTGYYWDNLGSYVDLSGYATKEEVTTGLNTLNATKSNEMKLLYRKKITADDGNVSFIEFLPETPLRKAYIYTRCDIGTAANTNKLYFKFGDYSYRAMNGGAASIDTANRKFATTEIDIDAHLYRICGNNDGYPGNLQFFNFLLPNTANMSFLSAIYEADDIEIESLIEGIKFSTDSETVYFPINTEFWVWGC